MAKTDYIVVSKKERKDVLRVKRALELLGINVDSLANYEEDIKKIENSYKELSNFVNKSFEELKDKVRNIDKPVDFSTIKADLLKHVDDKMQIIQENVVKSNQEVIGGIKTTFQSIFNGGHKIDEDH